MSFFHALLSAGATYNLISGYSLDPFDDYVDVYFDPNVYHSTGGAILITDLQLVFTQNGGTATNLTMSSISAIPSGSLSGGENGIRVHLTLTGSASGVEYFVIKPSAAGAFKDSNNRFVSPTNSTGNIVLNFTYDADYQALLDYAVANSITYPALNQRLIDNQFVLDLKSIGAWTESDLLYVQNGTRSNGFAQLNWKSPGNFTITTSSTVTYDQYGSISGGGYQNTHWVPGTNGVKFTQNDAGTYCYIFNDVAANTFTWGVKGKSGVGANQGRYDFIPRLLTSNNMTANINDNATNSGTGALADGSSQGMFHVSREASGTIKLYKNGTLAGSISQASTNLSSYSLFLNTSNNQDILPPGAFDTSRKIAIFGNGSGMQDIVSGLSTALTTHVDDSVVTPSDTGRLYMFSGQSNMQAFTNSSSAPSYLRTDGPIDRCYIWYNNAWEPLEYGVSTGSILVLSVMYEQAQIHTTGNLYCVYAAAGGTSMGAQWKAPSGSMLTELMSSYSNAKANLVVTSYEAYITFQGEADTNVSAYATAYQANEDAHMDFIFANTGFTKAIVCNIGDDFGYPYITEVRTAKINNEAASVYGTGGDLIETEDLFAPGQIHLVGSTYAIVGERVSAAI